MLLSFFNQITIQYFIAKCRNILRTTYRGNRREITSKLEEIKHVEESKENEINHIEKLKKLHHIPPL